MFKFSKRQKGLTLLEVLGGLAIFVALCVGAAALYISGNTSQQSNQAGMDIASLRTAVKQLYGSQGGYGSTSLNSVLINAGRVPSDLSVSGSTITNQFGGTITVTGATSAFTIAATNVPTANCIAMLTNANNGWTSIQVGAATAITTFPISPATAGSATNCAAAATNTITYTSS